MTDLLDKAAAWLNDQRHKHLTQTVTYYRGKAEVTLAATIGRTVFDQTDEFGAIHQIESRDFLVRAADLVLADETTGMVLASRVTLPEPGDLIREVSGDDTYVYEVMAPGGEAPYRFADAFRLALRIHTKLVDTTS